MPAGAFRAIVGESFAEIFFSNATALGMPCVVAPHDAVEAAMSAVEREPGTSVTVDLVTLRFESATSRGPCAMPASAREAFLAGTWDATALLTADFDEVRAVAARLPYGFETATAMAWLQAATEPAPDWRPSRRRLTPSRPSCDRDELPRGVRVRVDVAVHQPQLPPHAQFRDPDRNQLLASDLGRGQPAGQDGHAQPHFHRAFDRVEARQRDHDVEGRVFLFEDAQHPFARR